MNIKRKIRMPSLRALADVSFVSVAGALILLGTQANASDTKVLDEKAVIEIIRAEIARDPGFVLDAINKHVEQQQALERQKQDGQAVVARDEIAASEGRPYVGAEKAVVELVYFFDVNCGYCKRLDPAMRRIVEENKDIRVSHREIPILAESSRSAALLSNIVWQMFPGKYGEFHDALMANQGSLTDDILEVKLSEVLGATDAMAVLAEASNQNSEIMKKATKLVQENLSLAEKAGVTGTPFVFVLQNDAVMRGAGEDAYNELLGFINDARSKK